MIGSLVTRGVGVIDLSPEEVPTLKADVSGGLKDRQTMTWLDVNSNAISIGVCSSILHVVRRSDGW